MGIPTGGAEMIPKLSSIKFTDEKHCTEQGIAWSDYFWDYYSHLPKYSVKDVIGYSGNKDVAFEGVVAVMFELKDGREMWCHITEESFEEYKKKKEKQ